jgi:Na+-transporting NADH:ubiquinone oxidoreductase subunit NqrC
MELQSDHFLNRSVDGISGATLSVNAMNRMARLALYFDHISRTESH